MASKQEQAQQDQQFASNVGKAASTVKNALSAAAKAGAGNVTGAILDVLKDENMRKWIIGGLFAGLILIAAVAMMIGSAITGTVESLQSGLEDNWDQAWEEEGIYSQGNSLYLYSIGQRNAYDNAVAQTISDFILGLFNTDHTVDGIDATNQELAAESDTVTSSDYETALQSIISEESLIGENGAIPRQLDMIKGRVRQRGEQFSTWATTQYTLESIGIGVAEGLTAMMEDPILYNGINAENSTKTIDTSAFELTDIQALKIYAAYAIQHDLVLSNSDMWDLMDYCGWYSSQFASIETSELADDRTPNIYNAISGGHFINDVHGVVESGDAISSEIYDLSAPTVHYWAGTCAPQWYYEQISQLQKINESYNQAKEKAAATPETGDDELLKEMLHFETDADGNLILDNFQNLGSYETFGIIDKIFTGGSATLSVTATEYTGVDAPADEFLASIGSYLKSFWDEAFGERSKSTTHDNLVYRDTEDNHSYTIYGTDPDSTYYLVNKSTGLKSAAQQGNGDSLTFYGLHASTTYSVIQEIPRNRPASADSVQTIAAFYERFTTFVSSGNTEAYELTLDLNVGYAARTVDDLIYDLLGLWPGSLADTETGEDGTVYAAGHAGNENLRLTWTDVYTDPETGETTTLNFQRQQSNQAEAYQDIVLGLAETLGYDTTGLFSSAYGYGSTMISMAQQELEFYQANNLVGGQRYWTIAGEARFNKPDAYNYSQPWCAAFVNACAYQCGYIGPNGWYGTGNWPFWCGGIYNSLTNYGHATGHNTRADTYKPVPGDLIFFGDAVGCAEPDHIGIVEFVDSEGQVHTIEGNSGNSVKRRVYDSYLLGTFAWSNETYDVYISHYLNPHYPATFLENPTYLTIGGTTSAAMSSRTVGTDRLRITGLPRFREESMDEVLDELAIMYPQLYTDALRKAYPYDLGSCEADGFTWLIPCRYSKYTQSTAGGGIDLNALDGTQVFAVRDGIVTAASYNSSMGNYVILEHDGGYQTTYLYLQDAYVTQGETVTAGQIIGVVGTTGRSTDPHLHYEILKSGSPVDPKDYLGISNPDSFSSDYTLPEYDPTTLMSAWNMLCIAGKSKLFREAQFNIAAKLYVQPLAQSVTMETGFNWTATQLRQEILWGIATTSDNQIALRATMKAICAELDNTITDEELFSIMTAEDKLIKTVAVYKSALWQGESKQMQDSWINSIQLLIQALESSYLTAATQTTV